MEMEVIIGVAAVFISGAGVGVGVTVFTQWAIRKLTWHPTQGQQLPPPQGQQLPPPHASGLRREVEDLTRAVLDLNERMEFQERLSAGSIESKAKTSG